MKRTLICGLLAAMVSFCFAGNASAALMIGFKVGMNSVGAVSAGNPASIGVINTSAAPYSIASVKIDLSTATFGPGFWDTTPGPFNAFSQQNAVGSASYTNGVADSLAALNTPIAVLNFASLAPNAQISLRGDWDRFTSQSMQPIGATVTVTFDDPWANTLTAQIVVGAPVSFAGTTFTRIAEASGFAVPEPTSAFVMIGLLGSAFAIRRRVHRLG